MAKSKGLNNFLQLTHILPTDNYAKIHLWLRPCQQLAYIPYCIQNYITRMLMMW